MPHWSSPAHVFVHEPATHFGASPLHCASVAHVPPVAPGLQTPFSHVPPLQVDESVQPARHWPSAHTLPSAHSLENLHVFEGDVHAPPMQVRPPSQSVVAAQGHGPADPPHA